MQTYAPFATENGNKLHPSVAYTRTMYHI
jgi:hypothetical protein